MLLILTQRNKWFRNLFGSGLHCSSKASSELTWMCTIGAAARKPSDRKYKERLVTIMCFEDPKSNDVFGLSHATISSGPLKQPSQASNNECLLLNFLQEIPCLKVQSTLENGWLTVAEKYLNPLIRQVQDFARSCIFSGQA